MNLEKWLSPDFGMYRHLIFLIENDLLINILNNMHTVNVKCFVYAALILSVLFKEGLDIFISSTFTYMASLLTVDD
jgi:hypothetical protein